METCECADPSSLASTMVRRSRLGTGCMGPLPSVGAILKAESKERTDRREHNRSRRSATPSDTVPVALSRFIFSTFANAGQICGTQPGKTSVMADNRGAYCPRSVGCILTKAELYRCSSLRIGALVLWQGMLQQTISMAEQHL